MTFNRVRFTLLGIFLGFLAMQLALLFAVNNTMWPEESRNAALKFLAIYSMPVGVIVGAIAAKPNPRMKDPPASLAWTAIALVVLWNLLVAWRPISFSFAKEDSVDDLLKYIDAIVGGSSFLLAGTLTFFFGKATERT